MTEQFAVPILAANREPRLCSDDDEQPGRERTWWSIKVHRIRANLLHGNPDLPVSILQRLQEDFERFALSGLPGELERYLLEAYGLDVSTTYAGLPIRNPWGKASGQLSMTPAQVAEDAAAGLGFCVLKTVIAQDAEGCQSMQAWALPESRMVLERIRGSLGDEGWTVSWTGRGWSRSFQEYIQFVQSARRIGDTAGMLVVPSCKYHLPTSERPDWRIDEYNYTTQKLLDVYETATPETQLPMPIEKDFSPTLAGSDLATEKAQILHWIQTIPRLIRSGAKDRGVRVGLKLFNALFDDEFQLELLQAVAGAGIDSPDYLVYANRLFDPLREFEGHRGIAVGGPDLSQRNLRVLSAFQRWRHGAGQSSKQIECSATGDICSGKMAVEYMLRGCCNFQLHTFFQLPTAEYRMRQGSKAAKALHLLYFDPENGFIAWALHAANRLGMSKSSIVRLTDLVGADLSYERSIAG